jgi:hypothetical protein
VDLLILLDCILEYYDFIENDVYGGKNFDESSKESKSTNHPVIKELMKYPLCEKS